MPNTFKEGQTIVVYDNERLSQALQRFREDGGKLPEYFAAVLTQGIASVVKSVEGNNLNFKTSTDSVSSVEEESNMPEIKVGEDQVIGLKELFGDRISPESMQEIKGVEFNRLTDKTGLVSTQYIKDSNVVSVIGERTGSAAFRTIVWFNDGSCFISELISFKVVEDIAE